MKQTCKKWAT